MTDLASNTEPAVEGESRALRPSGVRPSAGESVGASPGTGTDEPVTMRALVRAARLSDVPYAEAKRRVLADFNDAYVASLLSAVHGNMSEAARRSGLDRSNFRRLVRTTTVDAAAVRRGGDPGADD